MLDRRCALRVAGAAALLFAVPTATRARSGNDLQWLALGPGTAARVDVAPWLSEDEPEAALTESAASMERDFSARGDRPGDVLYRPIGVRVIVIRLLPGRRIVLVRGRERGARWQGYARVERLVPEIPPGTALRAAGGFAGFADFFTSLRAPYRDARRLPTGSELTALDTGVAPYDRDTSNLVRIHVRVRAGPLRGQTGWIAAAYAGVPTLHLSGKAETAEKACRCRLVQFDSTKF